MNSETTRLLYRRDYKQYSFFFEQDELRKVVDNPVERSTFLVLISNDFVVRDH